MKNKAFTLIELLVVIAIIGILATVVLTSLGSARERARDARRQSDIRTIQQALEVYYLEHGYYPSTYGTGGVAPNNHWANSGNTSWQTLETTMGVDLPEDPINEAPVTSDDFAAGNTESYNYAYFSRLNGNDFGCTQSGQYYAIIYRLEKGDVTGIDRIGVVRCDNGERWYTTGGNTSTGITIGVTPAG